MMKVATIKKSQEYAGLSRAIGKCIQEAQSQKNIQEPDFTAYFAKGLPKWLTQTFVKVANEEMNPFGLRFGGCFIHQRPKVCFRYQRTYASCEIGDLLVLYKNIKPSRTSYCGVLLQLKMANKDKLLATDRVVVAFGLEGGQSASIISSLLFKGSHDCCIYSF